MKVFVYIYIYVYLIYIDVSAGSSYAGEKAVQNSYHTYS